MGTAGGAGNEASSELATPRSGRPAHGELEQDGVPQAWVEHIRRLVDAAPPLSAAQQEKLTLLLNPGAADGAG